MFFRRSFFTGKPRETALHFVSGTRQVSMLFADDALGSVEKRKLTTSAEIRKVLIEKNFILGFQLDSKDATTFAISR